ncbi:hypothetical protein NDU88_002110 [Pleurodeles waltl]|uniref:Uncharacterized protein n=1 Tax=Pleurodeles waltl TaxID=8319 RepID=A0AAV7T298_PLEWA|nr:hypothetical protein NDU88_002110 [Pleurodeles waltl]
MGRTKANRSVTQQDEGHPQHSQEVDLSPPTSVDCIPPTDQSYPVDKLDLILREIGDMWTTIEHPIDSLAGDLGLLRDDHCKLADKVRTLEETISKMGPQQVSNTASVKELQRRLNTLHDRAEDAEG